MPQPVESMAGAFARPDRPTITARMLLVAAHPDDETIGLGAQLHRCANLTLLHLTDGAPRNLVDAHRHGFEDAAAYAAARSRELKAALAAGGVRARTLSMGRADQGLWCELVECARELTRLVQDWRPEILVTHAYEGGHPDHDSAAFICQLATAALPIETRPARLEFAGYNAADGALRWGKFIDRPDLPVSEIVLEAEESERKAAMLACFTSQAEVLRSIPLSPEHLRPAPGYDFTQPPHAGALWYESQDWGAKGADWREAARKALHRLSAPP
jgi:LmbE family N-acetylglucosaminyl deacetylase